MQYQTIYNVLDDGYRVWGWEWIGHPFCGVILVLLVGWARANKWRFTGYSRKENPWPFIFIFGAMEIFFAGVTLNRVIEQSRCKRWAATGDYQVVEGEFKGIGTRKFRYVYVGDVMIPFENDSGGFRGDFTKRGIVPREGQPARMAYHEGRLGRILRIEVASPERLPAEGGAAP
jgi:hypothetical protein